MSRDPRRIDTVMREIRRPRGKSFPDRPGEDPKAVEERRLKAWQTMSRLMQDTREREDGTWYRT